jgi:P27 family predicted phage terminase small subunit
MAGVKGKSGGARPGAGRKKLPTEIKRIKGTLQKCRANPHEPAAVALLADPPAGMRDEAAAIWRYLLASSPQGLLHANNIAVLERYCDLMAQYRDLAKFIAGKGLASLIAKDGSGAWRRTGFFEVQMELSRALRDCEAELGFTPASRCRVHAALPGAVAPDDPWADIVD